MKIIAKAAAAALCVVLSAAAAPEAGAGFVEHFKAATRAHEAGDYPGMERELQAALKLRPGHPTALYKLAAARALRGEADAAVEVLETLAEMGLVYEPAADEDFAALRGKDAFEDVGRDLARNRRRVGDARVAFRLQQATFIPEGLAFDDDRKAWFVSGAHERRIQRVTASGDEQDFVQPGAGGLWAPLGMAAESGRRLLWVASAAVPEMENAQPDEIGRSAVLAYDLDTGRFRGRYLLDDGEPHLLGDLIAPYRGTLYATDSKAGRLYALDTAGGKFRALTPPGALSSPQGLVLSRDRRYLYVADYTQGLFRYALNGGELMRLEVAPGISVYGIDGLYRYDDDLIAVQNGIRPHRVVQFTLDRGGKRVRHARVLAANHEEFDEPTLGVVVGRRFRFVANSQWNKFDDQHRLPPAEKLRRPVVMWVDLHDEPPRERERAPRAAPQPAPGPALPLPRICPLPPC